MDGRRSRAGDLGATLADAIGSRSPGRAAADDHIAAKAWNADDIAAKENEARGLTKQTQKKP